MQEAVKRGEIRLNKVPGEHNPADLYTKGLAADRIRHLMTTLGYHYL